ncbi:MAG TPA: Spy/CpxP family protein refolding chaperone [Candidatus Saccharimonadales bacterium]|nr:Spy/CpxP family protein refolding chaperone [Candidatus Saccharimonadales bacterium]
MIKKLLTASLLFCGMTSGLMSGTALAQGGPRGSGFGPHNRKPGGEMHGILPPGRWWKDAEMAKNIGLNDVQVQKIEQIFQDSRMKLVDVHANLQKEELKLEPMLEADNPDENSVLSAIDRITAARASLEKANAQMAFAIRRVLTPDQWKKLHAMRPHREHFPPPMRGPESGSHREHNGPGQGGPGTGGPGPDASTQPPAPPANSAPDDK